jgi:hypothetical protein
VSQAGWRRRNPAHNPSLTKQFATAETAFDCPGSNPMRFCLVSSKSRRVGKPKVCTLVLLGSLFLTRADALFHEEESQHVCMRSSFMAELHFTRRLVFSLGLRESTKDACVSLNVVWEKEATAPRGSTRRHCGGRSVLPTVSGAPALSGWLLFINENDHV